MANDTLLGNCSTSTNGSEFNGANCTVPSTTANSDLVNSIPTAVAPVVLTLLATELVITWIVWYYGNRKTCPWYLQICAWIGWAMPLTVFTLLPLDMASSLYRQCVLDDTIVKTCDLPVAYVSRDVQVILWRTAYWTAQVMSYLVTPILRAYFTSGEFGFPRKLRDAVRSNALYYGSLGAVGAIAYLAYGFITKAWNPRDTLLPFAMACANAWGLFNIVLFLGSGTIQLPRDLWYTAYNKRSLRLLQFQAPRTRERFVDADAELHHAADAVLYVSSRVPESSDLRRYADRLVRKCPIKRASAATANDKTLPEKIDLPYLVRVHASLKHARIQRDRMFAMWRVLLQSAWRFQDVITNRDNADRRMHTTLVNKRAPPRFYDQRIHAAWYWYLWVRPVVFRALCVLAAILSAAIVWSEVTLFVTDQDFRPTLSLFSLVLDGRKALSYQAIQVASVCCIAYMIACTYDSLMQMSVFRSQYALLGNHNTDPGSLLFFGVFMSRIAYPLCYNFLTLSGNSNTSVFEAFMGSVNLSGVFGERFNLYVPILMALVCFATLFNLMGRVLAVFGFDSFFDEKGKQSDMVVNEGRVIVDQARRLEERRLQKCQSSGQAAQPELFAVNDDDEAAELDGGAGLAGGAAAQKTARLLGAHGRAVAQPLSNPQQSQAAQPVAPASSWKSRLWPFASRTAAPSAASAPGSKNGWQALESQDDRSEAIPLQAPAAPSGPQAAPSGQKAARHMFDDL